METNFNGGISDSGPLTGEVYLYDTYHGKVTRYGELKSTLRGGCKLVFSRAVFRFTLYTIDMVKFRYSE